MENCWLILLLSTAAAQFLFGAGPSFSGSFQGYNFEYHKSHKLLLVRNYADCYLVVADNALENAIDSSGEGFGLKADIVTQIQAGTGVTNSSIDDLRNDFHDYLGFVQCSRHHIHNLAYTVTSVLPSATSQMSTVTLQSPGSSP